MADGGMMGMMLRGMGVDADAMMEQARGVGDLIARLAAAAERSEAMLIEMRGNQLAMMTAMGIAGAPPDDETVRLIAHESRRFVNV